MQTSCLKDLESSVFSASSSPPLPPPPHFLLVFFSFLSTFLSKAFPFLSLSLGISCFAAPISRWRSSLAWKTSVKRDPFPQIFAINRDGTQSESSNKIEKPRQSCYASRKNCLTTMRGHCSAPKVNQLKEVSTRLLVEKQTTTQSTGSNSRISFWCIFEQS